MLCSPYLEDLKLNDRFKTPGVTIADEAIIDFSLNTYVGTFYFTASYPRQFVQVGRHLGVTYCTFTSIIP